MSEFDEYIAYGIPEPTTICLETTIGLLDVYELKASPIMLDTVLPHIEDDIFVPEKYLLRPC